MHGKGRAGDGVGLLGLMRRRGAELDSYILAFFLQAPARPPREAPGQQAQPGSSRSPPGPAAARGFRPACLPSCLSSPPASLPPSLPPSSLTRPSPDPHPTPVKRAGVRASRTGALSAPGKAAAGRAVTRFAGGVTRGGRRAAAGGAGREPGGRGGGLAALPGEPHLLPELALSLLPPPPPASLALLSPPRADPYPPLQPPLVSTSPLFLSFRSVARLSATRPRRCLHGWRSA